MKKIDEGGYVDFLKYLDIGFPLLRSKFPAQIEWSMLNVPYGVRKPLDMLVEDFDEFRRIEHEWLIDNEYILQYKGRPSFVVVIHGLIDIPVDGVVKVIKLTDNSTTIIARNIHGDENSYDIVGNIDWVNNKIRTV